MGELVNLIGVLTAGVAIFRYATLKIEKIVRDSRSQDVLLGWFKADTNRERYAVAVRLVGNRINAFFGPAESRKAFNRSMLIAFFYAIGFFNIAWIFGADGSLGGVPMWTSDPKFESWERFVSVFFLYATAAVCVSIWRPVRAASTRRVHERLPRFLAPMEESLSFLFSLLVLAALIIMAVGVLSALGAGPSPKTLSLEIDTPEWYEIAGGALIAVSLLVVANRISDNYTASVAALLGTFVCPAILALDLLSVSVARACYMMVLFWAILPLLNAIVDHYSWRISRELIFDWEVGSSESDVLTFIYHLLLDAIAAILFLLILALWLPLVVGLLNLIVPSDVGFDLAVILSNAESDSLHSGAAAWILGMIATTLVPTSIHILVICMSVPVDRVFPLIDDRVQKLLENSDASDEHPRTIARLIFFYVAVPTALLFLAIALFLGTLVYASSEYISTNLISIAKDSYSVFASSLVEFPP